MNIASEAPVTIEDNRPPDDWPGTGKIELVDLKVPENSPNFIVIFFLVWSTVGLINIYVHVDRLNTVEILHSFCMGSLAHFEEGTRLA
jgi:hypothetical protein